MRERERYIEGEGGEGRGRESLGRRKKGQTEEELG